MNGLADCSKRIMDSTIGIEIAAKAYHINMKLLQDRSNLFLFVHGQLGCKKPYPSTNDAFNGFQWESCTILAK